MPSPDPPQPTLAPHRLAARMTNVLGLAIVLLGVVLTILGIRLIRDPPPSNVHGPMNLLAATFVFLFVIFCLILAVLLWLVAPGIRAGSRTSMSIARVIAILVGGFAALVLRGGFENWWVLRITLPVIGLCVSHIVCITRASLFRGPSAGRGFEPVMPGPSSNQRPGASHQDSERREVR